jgi:hypothetical protein
MSSVLKTLIKAKAVISDPAHWTKDRLAKTSTGVYTTINSPDATCFCAVGALAKGCNLKPVRPTEEEYTAPCVVNAASVLVTALGMDQMRVGTPSMLIYTWNDHHLRTHAEVMEAFDKAIEIARTMPDTTPDRLAPIEARIGDG